MRAAVQTFVNRLVSCTVQNDDADNVAEMCYEKSGWYNMATQELAPGFRITADDIVVDVGCGAGSASVFAAKQGAEVVGVDIDPSEIENLKLRMRVEATMHCKQNGQRMRSCRALVSDCNPVPLPADYATAVLAMEVLEHVDAPACFLAELVRIGKRSARYFITVPDPLGESVQCQIAPATYWSKPNHIRIFERDEFQHAVEAAGLVVERRFSYGFFWSMWWILFWAVPKNDIPFGKSGDSDLLRSWNRTWKALLSTPQGEAVSKALENAMPKCQVIIARKP